MLRLFGIMFSYQTITTHTLLSVVAVEVRFGTSWDRFLTQFEIMCGQLEFMSGYPTITTHTLLSVVIVGVRFGTSWDRFLAPK